MYKKIMLMIVTFFVFASNTFALEKINNVTVNVSIDESGTATFTEEWQLNEQTNTKFVKYFYDASESDIELISISDIYAHEFTEAKKIREEYPYMYKFTNGRKKNIAFTTDGTSNTIIIQYKVTNIIRKFTDTEGLDWFFLSSSSNQEIGLINIYISGPISFNENNTALYAIGNDFTCSLSNGKIHIVATNIYEKTKIRLITSFTGISFTNTLSTEYAVQDYYEEYATKSDFYRLYKDLMESIFTTVVVILFVIFIVVVIVVKIIKSKENKNDFKNIISYNKSYSLVDYDNIPYYDSIPCFGDIYMIYFFANYYNIIHHRSNLIGAIIFKWILEDTCEIIKDENDKYALKIKDGVVFERALDLELYEALKNASTDLILNNNKLIRYCTQENEQFIKWYQRAVRDSITLEYDRRNVNIKGKKIYMNKIIYNEAVKIQGLKRYLLNFNQVPRQTELTEEVYKYLLVISILLGVDENLSEEILRKNPDNELAQKLKEFKNIKYLFANLYLKVFEEYSKKKHKKNKYVFHPEKWVKQKKKK